MSPARRSCTQLGVCQGRGCEDCRDDGLQVVANAARDNPATRFPFAPGVIEIHRRRHRRVRALLLSAGTGLAVAAVAGVVIVARMGLGAP